MRAAIHTMLAALPASIRGSISVGLCYHRAMPERAKSKLASSPADPRIPRRVIDPTLSDHLGIMTRAVFQAGLSWAIIAARWEAIDAAFERFDVARIAGYDAGDIDRLMATEGIIHSRKKFAGTIANARTFIKLERECGSIATYVNRFGRYDDLFADVHRRFAFVGDLSCYYWLFRTGNPVPTFERWIAAQPKDHPRMREMVATGRAEGTSSERADF
jgi:hypothetical protein